MRRVVLLVWVGMGCWLATIGCRSREPIPKVASHVADAMAAPATVAKTAPMPTPSADQSPEPGAYHVLEPLADTAAVDACQTDADCHLAPLRCCDCARGGLAVAVHDADAWHHAACASGTGTPAPTEACGGAPNADPTCRGTPRCLHGRCRVTIAPERL